MPKVRRYSGRLKIELSFNDRTDRYQVRLCPMAKREPCEKVSIQTRGTGGFGPRRIPMAVDSPRAYDHAASSAISFASDRIQQYAAMDRRGSGWAIQKPRRSQKR